MRQETVGQCVKCGRKFLTMPKDGIDHYHYGDQPRECGGKVAPTVGGEITDKEPSA